MKLTTQKILYSIVITLLMASVFVVRPVYAATYTVTKTADTFDGVCDADCSLRDAIVAANDNGGTNTITLPAGTYDLTLSGANADCSLDEGGAATSENICDLDVAGYQNLTIRGAGAGTTIINASNLNGSRVIQVRGQTILTLEKVTVTGGVITTNGGGGIRVDDEGNLSLKNSIIRNNKAPNGGGIYCASICNINVDLSIIGDSVGGNSATAGNGGAVYIGGLGGMTISNSEISFNTATGNGGGVYADYDASITFNRNNINNNSGAAIYFSKFFTGSNRINRNRIYGNSVAIFNDSITSINAEDNWWGCNAGPNNTGCDGNNWKDYPVDSNPWLELSHHIPASTNITGTVKTYATFCRSSDADCNLNDTTQGPAFTPSVFDALTPLSANFPFNVTFSTVAGTGAASYASSPGNVTSGVDSDDVTCSSNGTVTLNATFDSQTDPISATCFVQPSFGKSFTSGTISAGGTSTLTFTINNSNITGLTGLYFTDYYPTGVVNTNPISVGGTCGSITHTATADGNTFNLTSATIGPSTTCTITTTVTSVLADTYNNIATDFGSTETGSSTDEAEASLVVASNMVVTDSNPANGATLPSLSSITVNFSDDALNDGSANAANNIANFLLVEQGANNGFDTTSCPSPATTDDIEQTISSVTYDNNGGGGPYTATLTLAAPLAVGTYRLFICGTTSVWSTAGIELNNGAFDSIVDFTIVLPTSGAESGLDDVTSLPSTGFAPNRLTVLPAQPTELAYSNLGDLWLEIPSLGVSTNIVGVPQGEDQWDVKWLGNEAGWLNGTVFPTWVGNSVVTAHVTDWNGLPGPFSEIKNLGYGDKIIVHLYGGEYIFEVQKTSLTLPRSKNYALEHLEGFPYLTLITCQGYNPLNDSYLFRRVVRAVMVEVR